MSAAKNTAETLFFGGTLVTMEDGAQGAEALAVKNGRILAIGSRAEVEAVAGEATVRVDLEGRTLMPGLIEPHTHPAVSALLQGAPIIDIRAMTVPTWDAVLGKIKRKVAKSEPGEFIYLLGLDIQLHKGLVIPTLAELDALAPDNPLAIQTSNLHTLYCNSKAIEAAELTDESEEPVGGEFHRDADGKLNGVFVESKAVQIVSGAAMKSWGMERAFKAFEEAVWDNVKAGVTTLGELIYEPAYGFFFQALAEREDRPIRVRAYEQYSVQREPSTKPGDGNDAFAIIGIKMHADGSPFVGNISVSQPYLNNDITLKGMGLPEDYTGTTNMDAGQLEELVDGYARAGWQMAIHTQGDKSIDMALDAYEKIIKALDLKDHRFRLEHCALMRKDQIERAMELGVLVSFFPNHIYYWGEAIRDNLFGAERAERYMPMGDAAEAGMRFSLHGDAPMTDSDPLGYVQLAVTRQTRSGAVLGEAQCMPVARALKAVTIDAAYQLFLEDEIGTLAPGKQADFVVLADNPLEVPGDRIGSIDIIETWFGGRRVTVPAGF
jgi:hypothetical protein